MPDNREILPSKQYAYIIWKYFPNEMGVRDGIVIT